MKIKGFLRRFRTFLKLCFIRLTHYKNFKFGYSCNFYSKVDFRFAKGKIRLGKKIGIRRNCEFSVNDGAISIGDDCFFNRDCLIVSHEEISIGNNCKFGPRVMMFDHDYDYKNEDKSKRCKYKTSPIYIGDNCWIGAGTIILRGTSIGDNCTIGAGLILKGIIPKNSIVIQKREQKFIEVGRSKE